MLELKAEKREKGASLSDLRKKGIVPAVYYGSGVEATSVSVPLSTFKKVFKEAGESTVVHLNVDGKDINVLVHDVDVDPITTEPIHADFYVVDMKKKVKVHVPLVFTGVSPAVKELNGTLVKVVHEIEIEALPGDLPHEINVDISSLVNFDSNISVKDLVLPKGVVAILDESEVLASVVAQKEEVEEAPAAIDLTQIEVEKKGKKEEEEAPAEE